MEFQNSPGRFTSSAIILRTGQNWRHEVKKWGSIDPLHFGSFSQKHVSRNSLLNYAGRHTIRFIHESAIFSCLIEVPRAEIPNGRPWQKTNLMNIAPDRGSACWNPKWPAVTKDKLHEYCTGSRLCLVDSKMAGHDKRLTSRYCTGSRFCVVKSKMVGRY